MKKKDHPFEMQIFVCTNNMQGEKPSCGDHCGEEIFAKLRAIAKDKGLHPKIRVAQAKCLGHCGKGVNVMVYPTNEWYHNVQLDNVQDLADKYLT